MSFSKDFLSGIVVKRSIPLAARTTSAEVIVGASINIDGVEEIVNSISASVVAAGSIKIQDVQFADDSAFSVNVATFISGDYLNKNDRMSSVSAIDQTNLVAAGSAKLSLANLALNEQKWFRVRALASTGTPNTTAEVQTILSYSNKPQIAS
jgi:hypothetical protein